MCAFVNTPGEVLHRINTRYAPGHALGEMVAIQKDYRIFHPKASLRQIVRLLGVGPENFAERRHLYRHLDGLKKVPSDIDGMNGHDRILKARQDNLESDTPLPMYTRFHFDPSETRVTVEIGRPIPTIQQDYIIISEPAIMFLTPTGRAQPPTVAA
jgi:hypothetical protein